MKRFVASITVMFLISGSLMQAQTLDEILKEHFSAIGQENQVKITSMKVTGKMLQGGIEIPFIQMAKRPDKVRLEGTFQELTFIQTYNGKESWSLNPFTGVTDPQPGSEDELKSMRYQADMDGMLWNWEDKGYDVTFDGKEDMEGSSCFKIKLLTKEGDSFTYFIDSDSYILLRTTTKIKVMGNDSESNQYFSNYMQVDGIAIPGKIETKMNGQVMMTMVIDKVEFDTEINDNLFDKPSL